MKDLLLTDRAIFDLVQVENLSQARKWGIQDRSPFEWLAYTVEEVGEMAQAISEYEYRNGRADHVAHEAIQAATLCLKIAEMFFSCKAKPTEASNENPD